MKSHLFILSFGILALLFPSVSQAYYNPETGRWLNRDPLAEQGGINLYCMVSNDPVNRRDFLGMKEDCSDPCGRWKREHPNDARQGSAGGTICCGGRKYACAWTENTGTVGGNAAATDLADDCILKHEKTHFGDVDCQKTGCEWASWEPGMDRADQDAEECSAYRTQLNCLNSKAARRCNGDINCINEIVAEIQRVEARIREVCH